MRIIKSCKISFANKKIEQEFLNLKKSNEIKKHIEKAIVEIKQNAFCATPIPKRLIDRKSVV